MTRTGRVVIASTRAAAAVYEDRTGPLIVEWLTGRGVEAPDAVVVADGEPVETALRGAVADGVDVVITSGGTGISPTDATPQATAAVIGQGRPSAGHPEAPVPVVLRYHLESLNGLVVIGA